MTEENQNKEVYGKKYLWLWIIGYIVLAVVIYAAVYYLFFAKSASNSNPTGYQNSGATNSVISSTQTNNSQAVKFSDTADSKYAYLISTDNYDAKTKLALTGFKVDRTVSADGTQQINLIAQEAGYQNQSYTVASGQKLYFIEKFLQDDQNGQEKNMGDDKAVLVDANGYVVQ